MPHAGNKIANQKRPPTTLFEPCVHSRKPFRGQIEKAAILEKDVSIEYLPQKIAEGDAARTAKKGCRKSGQEHERMLENQIPGKRQQPLIWHRQTDYAERQQRENSG